jgi:hypothetical protein
MKHVKLFESFEDKDSETLISNFKTENGNLPKYFKIRFGGIHPNYYHSNPGHWDIIDDRILTVPIQPHLWLVDNIPNLENLKEHILQNLIMGKIHVREEDKKDPYIGTCFDISNLKQIASSCESLEDFWDTVDDELESSGIREYYREFGQDEDSDEDPKETLNPEAFYEIWRDYVRTQQPKFWIE